jgi:DNA-binding transcriptional LysR family regulator
MIEQKLSRIDLNLLISLSVLLKEKNVSKAANALYISQSAMSRTLQRLRETFDDPLFYRTSDGMIASEKAKKIGKLLPSLLSDLEAIVGYEVFEPSACSSHFSVSIPPLVGHATMLSLLQKLAQVAPKVTVREAPPIYSPLDVLESGGLDFALHTNSQVGSAYDSTYIGQIDLSIFARKEHPLFIQNKHANKSTSLSDCLTYQFVGLSIEAQQNTGYIHPLDTLLKRWNAAREVVFSSHQLQVLTTLMKVTDHLLIGPSALKNSTDLMAYLGSVYDFELPDSDQLKFYLLSHKRIEFSEEHQWFKGLLLDSLKVIF